jgi:OOP family OmpA-OmpF porin
MAKNYFLLILLFCCKASFSQIKIGLMGGPQMANITEKNSIPGWDTATGKYYSGKSGFHVGMMAEIPISNYFYFEPAILYTQKGRNYAKAYQTSSSDSFYSYNSNISLSIQYVDIPLNVAYKIPISHKKTNSFLISAGPYLSLFYNGKETINEHNQFSSSTQSSDKTINTSEVLDVGKKDDSYRTFGYGVNARAGFELGNVTLTGFYSQGLDNLYYATYSGTFNHKVYGASLGIWLGQIKDPVKPVVKDKDGDGIPDDKDECPLLPGTAITHGCPDKDGDGIADKNDKCIDVAGLVKYDGCPIPDTDKDGVNDEEDKCPLVAGTAKYHGCPVPDKDNDGVSDDEDKCPTVAGTAKYHGCPIPDTAGDGINDEEDKCPAKAGKAAEGGCPVVIKPEIIQTVDYAAENIFFLHNSSVLSRISYGPLNTVVDILRKNPKLDIVINGYADNTGSVITNLAISNERALAVKKYLIEKGIDPLRIDFNGFGEANPVASNKTEEGRAKNRRVELKLKQL